ncbi:hypothetical protein GCM10010246_37020 [Streptomyces cuspidosporus]|uniref:Uncharacterized protein n=1 Tax=Streptomyces cuspidosporus TaxID=66882 RepID=A0ABN3GA84_9ACTN
MGSAAGSRQLAASPVLKLDFRRATDAYVSVDWEPTSPDFRVTVWASGDGPPQPVVARAEIGKLLDAARREVVP